MTKGQKTRPSLILRLKSHQDAEAWAQFCEIYEPLILRIAKRRGLQDADAEDLVQGVLVRIARSVQNWDPDEGKGSFRAWIGTIARNLTIDLLRRKNRGPVLAQDLQIADVADTCTESSFFDREYERQLFQWAASEIRSEFSESTWQAFWMTAVESRSIADVARSLNISKGAVYIARSRVIARLRQKVDNVSGFQNTRSRDQQPEVNS